MAIETITIPSKAKSSLKSSVKHFVNSNLTTTYTKDPLFWDLTVHWVTVSSYFLLFFSNCSYLSFVNCFLIFLLSSRSWPINPILTFFSCYFSIFRYKNQFYLYTWRFKPVPQNVHLPGNRNCLNNVPGGINRFKYICIPSGRNRFNQMYLALETGLTKCT